MGINSKLSHSLDLTSVPPITFDKEDERAIACLTGFYPTLVFTMATLEVSGPLPRVYQVKTLREEMTAAATSFLRANVNVSGKGKKPQSTFYLFSSPHKFFGITHWKQISLPRLLQWHAKDFKPAKTKGSEQSLLRFISEYLDDKAGQDIFYYALSEPKKAKLVKWCDYDTEFHFEWLGASLDLSLQNLQKPSPFHKGLSEGSLRASTKKMAGTPRLNTSKRIMKPRTNLKRSLSDDSS